MTLALRVVVTVLAAALTACGDGDALAEPDEAACDAAALLTQEGLMEAAVALERLDVGAIERAPIALAAEEAQVAAQLFLIAEEGTPGYGNASRTLKRPRFDAVSF